MLLQTFTTIDGLVFFPVVYALQFLNMVIIIFPPQTTSIMPVPQGISGIYDFRKITPEYIEKETDALINKQRAVFDTVGSLPLDQVTYDNVIKVRKYT